VTTVRAYSGTLVRYALLVVVALVFVVPLYWLFSASLKDLQEIYTFPPVWVPADPKFSNYSEAWNAAPFGRFYLNTLITTLFGVALEVVNAVLTAYALVFLRFPGKNIVFIVMLAALMIPIHVTILPNYLTVASLG
jgi:ABC-type glycerol-3-phosphate transport system permease component